MHVVQLLCELKSPVNLKDAVRGFLPVQPAAWFLIDMTPSVCVRVNVYVGTGAADVWSPWLQGSVPVVLLPSCGVRVTLIFVHEETRVLTRHSWTGQFPVYKLPVVCCGFTNQVKPCCTSMANDTFLP